MKRCLYCNAEMFDDSIVDFCETCGKKVWGDKMFNAIVKNMEEAKKKGDI